MEKLLSIDELCEFLGVTKATIYSWTSNNKIPHVKLSKRLLKFREEEIKAWIIQKSVKTDALHIIQKRKNINSKVPQDIHDDYIDRIIKNAKEEVLGGSH